MKAIFLTQDGATMERDVPDSRPSPIYLPFSWTNQLSAKELKDLPLERTHRRYDYNHLENPTQTVFGYTLAIYHECILK